MTTIMVLVVLWKMGFIFISASPIEKGKEILNVDVLSQLLKQEYPRIGEDINSAYRLFENVRFESEDQIDFKLLNNTKFIYVNFRPETNEIESMELHSLRGDTEKILSLGELMLPDDFLFMSENNESIEKRNEIFRYTKTEYTDTYYYELQDSGRFAFIQINHDISDLVEEKSDPRYSLVVSFVDEELQNKLTSEKNKQVQMVTQPVESNDAETRNLERILSDNFLDYVAKGKVPDVKFGLGTKIQTIMNQWGEPDSTIETEGGYYLMYDKCGCGFGTGYDYESYPDEVYSVYLPIYEHEGVIFNHFGLPIESFYSESESQMHSPYTVTYDVKGYIAKFERDFNNEDYIMSLKIYHPTY